MLSVRATKTERKKHAMTYTTLKLEERLAKARQVKRRLERRIDPIDRTIRLCEKQLGEQHSSPYESEALRVIEIEGPWTRVVHSYDEAKIALQNVIQAFALPDGLQCLRSDVIGCKSYDRWHCQQYTCPYNCWPRHGSVICTIGLRAEWRKSDLSDTQRASVLAYLRSIERAANGVCVHN